MNAMNTKRYIQPVTTCASIRNTMHICQRSGEANVVPFAPSSANAGDYGL